MSPTLWKSRCAHASKTFVWRVPPFFVKRFQFVFSEPVQTSPYWMSPVFFLENSSFSRTRVFRKRCQKSEFLKNRVFFFSYRLGCPPVPPKSVTKSVTKISNKNLNIWNFSHFLQKLKIFVNKNTIKMENIKVPPINEFFQWHFSATF